MPTLSPDHRARLILMRATAAESPAVHAFVHKFGALGALGFILDDQAPDAVNAELRRPAMAVQRDLDMLESGGARFITPQDREWPPQLLAALGRPDLYTPPLGLWARGQAKLNDLVLTLAVLGGCQATSNGDAVASTFTDYHVAHGTSLVTTADPGIAHSALFAAMAYPPTEHTAPVVTLPAGIDVDCSADADHYHLLAEVVRRGGLLISPHPVGTSTRCRDDLHAHRKLAVALGQATLIVEGSTKAPAVKAARLAHQLDRPLYAAPGSSGTDRLITRTGAIPAPHSSAITRTLSSGDWQPPPAMAYHARSLPDRTSA